MSSTAGKTKLTLWVEKDIKEFGKQWAKKHNESVSEVLSNYLVRLKRIEEKSSGSTPTVNRITGVIRGKKISRKDYKKHLEDKYLHA